MTSSLRALRFALALSALLPSTAIAGAWLLPPGDWSSEIRGTFFNADTYHAADGNRWPLAQGGVFEQRPMAAWSEFGWKKNLGVFVAIPFVSASRRFADETRLPAQTVFGDMDLGARFALKGGATALSLNARWRAPMGYNREMDPALVRFGPYGRIVPPPGRGLQNVAGTLAFGAPLAGRGFIELEAGYNHSFEFRFWRPETANHVIASAGAGFWVGPVLIGGRYAGAVAAGGGGDPLDRMSEHLAGPVVLYRIDDHIDLSAGSLHTAAGENVLHADRVYVALTVKQSGLNRLQGFLGNAQQP